MLKVRELITDALRAYDECDESEVVPRRRNLHPNHIHASSLDDCPLKVAYQRLGVPETDDVMDDDKRHLLRRGNYSAAEFQEALKFYTARNVDYGIQLEVPMTSEELNLAGRADGILTYRHLDSDYARFDEVRSDRIILEFKDTEGKVKRSVPEMRENYALQVIAYSLMSGIPDAAVVLASKWSWHVWYIRPIQYSNLDSGFLIRDEHGQDFVPTYGDNWNTPEYLNYNTIRAKVKELQRYIDDTEIGFSFMPPIADPLNDKSRGWRCCMMMDEGRKTDRGGGTPRLPGVEPNCPYFSKCHGKFPRDGKLVRVERDGDSLKFPAAVK